MNVLVFVTTMLMLLTIMTYTKLETYRNSQIFQILFENYMEKDERGYINMVAETTYEAKTGSKKKSSGPKKKIAASPRISLSPILNKAQREKAPQQTASFTNMLKNLIDVLYNSQPFYKTMKEQRPSFVDEIIDALVSASGAAPKELKKTHEIANLKLGDEQLDDVFYKMLAGAPYKNVCEICPPKDTSLVPKEQTQKEDDISDEASVHQEMEEHHSPQGYFSLLDFIVLQPSEKVRIYLASKEVLKAIYGDDNIVNDIMNKRNELYRQTQSEDEKGIQSLSDSFKNEFNNRQDSAIANDVLDFTISKTNPKKYE